jgi:hypothetical protein
LASFSLQRFTGPAGFVKFRQEFLLTRWVLANHCSTFLEAKAQAWFAKARCIAPIAKNFL